MVAALWAHLSARCHAPLPQCARACSGSRSVAHACGERSTTALAQMSEGEKTLLPIIICQSPSPAPESLSLTSSLLWQVQCAEGDLVPAVLLTTAVPGPVQLAPRPPVRRAAAARATCPARSGPRLPVLRAAARGCRPRYGAHRRRTAAGPACGLGRRSGAHRPGPPVWPAAAAVLHTFGKHLYCGCGRNREQAGSVRQTK